jgi:hypothetical protein
MDANTKNQKPTTPKTLGLVISIMAGFAILSNSMGALVFSTFLSKGIIPDIEAHGTDMAELAGLFFNHYVDLCLAMVVIDIVYLIGGLYLRKYKLWANRLLTYFSGLLILLTWSIMIYIVSLIPAFEFKTFISIFGVICSVFWTAPLGILIWYLNRKKVIAHFE